MSKKNKKQTAPKKPQTAPKKPEINEENIPVQSLSEMLAFAVEAEAEHDAKQMEKVAETEKPVEDVSSEEKSSEAAAPEAKEEPIAEKPVEDVSSEVEPVEVKTSAEVKKAEPAKETVYKNPDGMPISEKEAARQAASLDALDRDLAAARNKKLQEEAYNKRQREIEQKKEAERIAKAEQAKLRQANAAAAAKKLDEVKAEAQKPAENTSAPKAAPSGKNATAKHFNRNLNSMIAGRAAAGLLIVAALAYCGSFLYVKGENDKFYDSLGETLSGQVQLADEHSVPYVLPEASALMEDEKISFGLSMGMADTDKDGLSDEYEIKISETDPAKEDTDGDGLADGREIKAGLNPLEQKTDGTTPDNEVIKEMAVGQQYVTADIKGIPSTAYATLTEFANNSIHGTPGIVGKAYEFYSDKNYEECTITFRYTDADLNIWGVDEYALAVFRFNGDDLVFEKLESTVDAEKNLVSAKIDKNGVYAICDSNILSQVGDVNIFFLIDNSGSMYPEELCAGSEENDVEFKRLDFATNLIDMLGTDVNFGAGEFSGGYSNIVPISGDAENVKKKISDIRNKVQVFSGTEIAGAITSAVNEFSNTGRYDKNYMILLTDGMPSNYNMQKEQNARELAKQNNITIFTIGLGKYIDSSYLSQISEDTNGQFFQASNADALENIYEKIQNFLSYNRVTIEEESGEKGYIVADSGFNVLKDGIAYTNFRSDFAPNGADAGLAGLIRDYYIGSLKPKADGYVTDDGRTIPGYDISSISGFSDTRIDFNAIEISMLSSYNTYMSIPQKWDYRNISGETLHLTESAREYCRMNNLSVSLSEYKFRAPEDEGLLGFLRSITFSKLKDFSRYECALIDTNSCEGDDLAIMNLINWYCNLPFAADKCTLYDFGYEGDMAFEMLMYELTTGDPAVIVFGGTAMNAVRVARSEDDPDSFIIDAYDCNDPGRATKIHMERTPIYNDQTIPSFQYIASRGGEVQPLVLVTYN